MPIELFIADRSGGLGAASASHRQVKLRGTLNLDWLSKAALEIPAGLGL